MSRALLSVGEGQRDQGGRRNELDQPRPQVAKFSLLAAQRRINFLGGPISLQPLSQAIVGNSPITYPSGAKNVIRCDKKLNAIPTYAIVIVESDIVPVVLSNRSECYARPMKDHETLDHETDLRVKPNPDDPRLTVGLIGVDHTGASVKTRVPVERSLTLFLNGQEIVTAMTIGDYPEDLAIGYFLNQGMLRSDDKITGIDYDEDLSVVIVRTARKTNYEEKLRKKTQTSGCAQGTAFGDLMDVIEGIRLPASEVRTSWLYRLMQTINTIPSLYLEAGAMHGAVLCWQDKPLLYMEDVGRHNAVDKIAGYMHRHGISAGDKIFYTTGRLTSEMIIKTVRMGIPSLISRSGFTAWGVELARQTGLTLIGRARGKRFLALSGPERIVFDQNMEYVPEESQRHRRKAAGDDA